MRDPSLAKNADNLGRIFDVGDLRVDIDQQQVLRGSKIIELPPLSFDLLIALARNAPNPVTVDDLIGRVWPGLVVSPETVSQRVMLLRNALGDDARAPHYIAGRRGRGYRLVVPVASVPPPLRTRAGVEPPPNSSSSTELSPLQEARFAERGEANALVKNPKKVVLILLSAVTVAVLVLAAGYWQRRKPQPPPVQTSITVLPVLPHTVAVLPFESLSADHADDYLARGIPEVLVTRLGAARELLVIASASSFALQEKNINVSAMGRLLNARYLVGGSVQRNGARLRVTVHLMDAESGHQLTAIQFDRKLDDIFQMEDDIADQIAAALEVSVVRVEAQRGDSARSSNLDAYLAYLKGKASLRRWRVAESRAAMTEFERATKLDPTFAPAYAELAMATIQSSWLRFQDNAHLADTISPLLDRALALDDSLGEAYVARGVLESKDDVARAEADFRKGIALSPNYAAGYALFAQSLGNWRRSEEARQLIDRALLIDPLSPQSLFVRAFLGDGPDDFDHFMLEALKVDPDFFPALKSFGWRMWLWRRQAGTAIKLTERAIRLDPHDVEIRHSACDMYLDVGDLAAAEQVIEGKDLGLSSAPMMIAMYKDDWRTAGSLAYSIPARLREESEGLEVGSAIFTYAVHTKDFARAETYLRELWKMKPGHELDYDRGAVYIAELMRLQGKRAEAQRIFDGLPNVIQKRPEYNFRDSLMGVLMVVTGRPDAGLDLLARETERLHHHPYWYVVFRSDELLRSVRNDPRFQAILAHERAYSAGQRALLEQMRQTGDVPFRGATSTALSLD
jgi:TolB-like protein/DNA-binding winged helix-turn-helix (wHTH) protein